MDLYYAPFACSLAAHIALREGRFEPRFHRADLATKRVEGGADLLALNPMGQVPTLVTDDGRVLMENGAVLQYLTDHAPDGALAPPPGDFARYEVTRWVSFVATEIHKKGLALIFGPDSPDAVKDFARAAVARPLRVVEGHLSSRRTLLGDAFTVADAYLFWALLVLPYGRVPLDAYPALRDYQARVQARPAVEAAMDFERAQRERPFAA